MTDLFTMLASPGEGLAASSEAALEASQSLRIHAKPFIGGTFVDPRSERRMRNISPISGQVINEVAIGDESDVDAAVSAARHAFDAGIWSGQPPAYRKEMLLKLAAVIDDNSAELSLLDAIDVGKPWGLARGIDLRAAATAFRWYGELSDKLYGRVAPTANTDLIVREPFGVTAAVTPWNYPMMILAWKVAPMLAAGNCVVLKPAEQSPLSALRFAELACQAGLPSGVLNVVPGDGPTTGAALGLHEDVDALGFTGSSDVGKLFLGYAGQSNMKSVSLECGGKSPILVFADADVRKVAAAIASAVFYNAGQSCNAPTRAIVHSSIADAFVAALVEEAASYQPGNSLAEGCTVGSIVSEEQLVRIEGFVAGARSEGARIETGGTTLHKESGGFYYAPTVISGTTPSMEINREEIFGPVMPVMTFETYDEAIALANKTRFGLWANVWTNELGVALKASRDIRAGTVAVNTVWGGDITTPMGGYKQSGIGRDRGVEGLQKYTQTKHISLTVGS